ncbi:LacI family DNA-binding transcriptional regulator [Paenibacillus sp. MMS20-IR301]|uniref:LacI family DNA-binding transcriptional regulator n=1 Tax=Paenibacillus sp. MMS20-IR301 TaxID=2895946 RepID=UPI0028E5E013|nr:LacI family DNA-binding transcriptional regulator [Paenibacillus sp. MMS20-IR301]WNS43159.1 LacI family DNA-binding transcriptional regulator [Paenibacillus sp. MMS20-IR301]
MSNLDHIAKLSGFSKATVSRVLNHSPHVSEATRNKIMAIMDELDYVPNGNAISLSKGQTEQIGMVTEGINEVMLPFLNSFVEAASRHGYQTIIYTSGGDPAKELQAFEDMRRKRVDALVITTCVNDQNLLGSFCKYGPIVSWQRMELPQIQSVAMDQYGGYMLGLEHVIARGYTRIANAFGRPTSINTSGRNQAFQDIARKYGLNVNPDWSPAGIHSIRQGEQLVRELMQCAGDRPNAILCANDLVAAGVLNEARRLQVKVPEELAIVGFDNTELAHTLGITSINNPIAAQAENAFRLILSRLKGTEAEQQQLEFGLVQRATT